MIETRRERRGRSSRHRNKIVVNFTLVNTENIFLLHLKFKLMKNFVTLYG